MAPRKPPEPEPFGSGSELLEYDDRPIELFTPPGWERPLRLRAPAMGVVLKLGNARTPKESDRLTWEFVRQGIVNEAGEPLLSPTGIKRFIDEKKPDAVKAIQRRLHELAGIMKKSRNGEGPDAEAKDEGN